MKTETGDIPEHLSLTAVASELGVDRRWLAGLCEALEISLVSVGRMRGVKQADVARLRRWIKDASYKGKRP